MTDYFARYDQDVMQRLMQWSRKIWGKAYAENFKCAHPWVLLMNEVYHKNLEAAADFTSAYLANFWYTRATSEPMGRDNLAFRFQIDTSAIDALRPDGAVHIELVIYHDSHANAGVCMGVGEPAGAIPLNGTFGLHPYGVGMLGDGWFDDSGTTWTEIRFINVEGFKL